MLIWQVIQQSLYITAFVTMMMLIIEYINVLTSGVWISAALDVKWKQYLIGALLGAMPGCLGAFAIVGLYSHKRVSIGTLVATMIATSGDEAFVMLAMFPKTALFIFLSILALGIFAGWIVDNFLFKNQKTFKNSCSDFKLHSEWEGQGFPKDQIVNQWHNLHAVRGILAVAITLFLVFIFAFKFGLINQLSDTAEVVTTNGHGHGHDELGWEWITLVSLLFLGLFIISTVSDHFLDEHLWKHVLKEHMPKIFIWTLGALLTIAALNYFFDIDHLVKGNLWVVLLVAVAIGIIPESGPHLIFVTLFATGSIPLSVLVASSIVQDGHGMVPLLAHSRKDFIIVKLINMCFGLAVGAAMLALEL